MARERVAALSDAEAAELAKQFDRAPAGGAFTGFLIIFFLAGQFYTPPTTCKSFQATRKPQGRTS